MSAINYTNTRATSEWLQEKVARLRHYEDMITHYQAFLDDDSRSIMLGSYEVITFKQELLTLAINRLRRLHVALMTEILEGIDERFK